MLNNNNLTKAIPVRLTKQQNIKIERLKNAGFKRSFIIRLALDKYLADNFKKMVKKSKICPF